MNQTQTPTKKAGQDAGVDIFFFITVPCLVHPESYIN